MICVAYFSSAVSPMSPADLGEIVAQAQQNNAARGITGLLCHYDGSFLQFLEGPDQPIDRTLAKIMADPRHQHVLPVHRRDIDTRLFGEWSMGIVSPQEVSPAQQSFCQGLRVIEIEGDGEHRAELSGILKSFRTWLR